MIFGTSSRAACLLQLNITNSVLRRKYPSQDPENLETMFNSLLDQGSVFQMSLIFTPNKVAREWAPVRWCVEAMTLHMQTLAPLAFGT